MSLNITKSTYLAMAVSFICLVLYIMILVGFAYLGDSVSNQPKDIVPIIAAAGYLAGGVLIYFKEKRLILLGLIINPIVIALYFVANIGSIEIYGVIIKIFQLALEYLLYDIYKSIE